VRPWIVYSLLRFGIFAALFALLAVFLRLPLQSMGIAGFAHYMIAALAAALISLATSYIFFAKLRAAVASDIAERRARANRGEVDDDTAKEDALLDGETPGAGPAETPR
jgi:heme exporter protein D